MKGWFFMICTTITEAMERNKGNYIGVEVYEYDTNDPYYKKLHTDFIHAIDEDLVDHIKDREDIGDVEVNLMDRDEYNSTVLANAYGVSFDDIYGDPNGKVLVLMLEHGWDDED